MGPEHALSRALAQDRWWLVAAVVGAAMFLLILVAVFSNLPLASLPAGSAPPATPAGSSAAPAR